MHRFTLTLVVLLAVLLATVAHAAEDHLATLSSTNSTAATYVATAGASLSLQCTGRVRYAAGTAAVLPTATSTSFLLDFLADAKGREIQLTPTQDRISVVSAGPPGSGFVCQVFSQTSTAVAGVRKCLVVKQRRISVGTSPIAVPASAQSARTEVVVCVSGENTGSPKVKCLVDPSTGKPVFGAAEHGDVLAIGGIPCVSYPVDTSHAISCVADTAATYVDTTECVPQ